MIKRALLNAFNSLHKTILHKLITRKLKEAEFEMPPEALEAFINHLLSGQKNDFVWKDELGFEIKNLVLEITEEDLREVESAIEKALEVMPEAIHLAVENASKLLFKSLKKRWNNEYLAQQNELQAFKESMEQRWGEGFGYLRMLLTCCREIGAQTFKRHNKSRSKRQKLRRWVLVRLHTRACQVADEIICLIENGFAEGAMARWRTLHELSVIAILISDGDEDLAERYILHDAVEVKRQADEYEASQVPLGGAPISKRERKEIDREYLAALGRYGTTFAHPYGWAAKHLNQKKPTFKDLQLAADRADMGSYYKLASFNIHASARSLFFNLSAMGDQDILLAGRCNAGFVEPGERMANTLTLITILYVGTASNFDLLIALECLIYIRDAVGPALRKADRRLLKDERMIRKAEGDTKENASL